MQNNTFSTLFVGQNFIKLKEVDSTNNYLKKLTSNSEPLTDGTVIMADHQFAGRGQQQNIWQTEPGKNISTSIYFKLNFLPINKQFYLNIAVSLAVCNVLSEFLPQPVEVKWPNDIYYGQKKIAGILIENTLTGSVIKSTIIGIGININQLQFVPGLEQRATSIAIERNLQLDLAKFMERLLINIEKYYFCLKAGDYKFLHSNYLSHLYNYNKKALYKENDHIFEATVKGVNEIGQLLVETEEGVRSFNFKEIEFIHRT